MELQITLPENASKESVTHLKHYIDQKSIDSVLTELEKASYKSGELGIGMILGSIKLIIDAAQKPLIELVKCLQKYVDTYRTEIKIGEITISKGRSMKPEELESLVIKILRTQNKNAI